METGPVFFFLISLLHLFLGIGLHSLDSFFFICDLHDSFFSLLSMVFTLMVSTFIEFIEFCPSKNTCEFAFSSALISVRICSSVVSSNISFSEVRNQAS